MPESLGARSCVRPDNLVKSLSVVISTSMGAIEVIMMIVVLIKVAL
jgi:hypothetical protein